MPRRAHLVTGPTHTGKTGRLLAWAKGRSDLGGLAAPDAPGGRRMLDLRSGEFVEMERPQPGEATVSVGPYLFRQAAFDWACRRLLEAAADPRVRFLAVDEIGPLELRGQGLAPALDALGEGGPVPVVVVRESLTAEVAARFDLEFVAGDLPSDQ